MQGSLIFIITIISYASAERLQSHTQNINSCDVTNYPGILYQTGNMLGPNIYLTSSTFEGCISKCQNRPGCVAVNYKAAEKKCGLLNAGISDPDKEDPENYANRFDTVHAYLQCAEELLVSKNIQSSFASESIGCGRQAPGYEPRLSNSHTRIIGGTEAKPHSWPWMVTLLLQIDDYWGICGGSLLRVKDGIEESDIILTAAHCVTKPETQATKPESLDASKVKTMIGNHNREINETGELFPDVQDIRHHPEFKYEPENGANNDIALIKLATPVKFTDTIRPICLPNAGEDLPIGKLCVAAGWGRNSTDSAYKPPALQQLVVPVHDAEKCKGGFFCWNCWGSTYKEDQMICAGSEDAKTAPCKGDSGGQLACQQPDGSWTLYGATSFAVNSCLNPNKPPIFARLSSYIGWINKNMAEMTAL